MKEAEPSFVKNRAKKSCKQDLETKMEPKNKTRQNPIEMKGNEGISSSRKIFDHFCRFGKLRPEKMRCDLADFQ